MNRNESEFSINKFINKHLIGKTGKYKHTVNDISWYKKHKYMPFIMDLITYTNHLSRNVLLIERLYNFKNNITAKTICKYCNVTPVQFQINRGKYKYKNFCDDIKCKLKFIDENNKRVHCNRIQTETEKLKRANSIRGRKVSQKTRDKLSKALKISLNNPQWRQAYNARRYTKKARKKQSNTLKEKILNGVFIPASTNSWCHSKIKYNGINYRSSWEVVFHILNNKLEYESIRIPYTFNNEKHIYIIDFVDRKNKILYEIKPNSLLKLEKNIAKINGAKQWCKENDFIFKLITEDYFINNVTEDIYKKLNSKVEKNIKRMIESYKNLK